MQKLGLMGPPQVKRGKLPSHQAPGQHPLIDDYSQTLKSNGTCPASFENLLGNCYPSFSFQFLPLGMRKSVLWLDVVFCKQKTCSPVSQIRRWREILPKNESYPRSFCDNLWVTPQI